MEFRKSIIFLFLMVFLVIFGIFGSFIAIWVYLSFSGDDSEEIHKDHYFQYLQRDYGKNETFYGVIIASKEINCNFYTDKNGQILISNFGDEEYECTGSCYCNTESDRRNPLTSSVLRSGIRYLVVATSSVVALNFAKKYFESECVEKYSETCESDSVVSEIHVCESIFRPTVDDRIEIFDEEEEKGSHEEWRKYYCYGNCVMKKKSKTWSKEALKQAKSFNCERLKREGEIQIFESDVTSYFKVDLSSLTGREQSVKYAVAARFIFVQRYLTGFCRENSQVSYLYTQPNFLIKNKKGVGKWKQRANLKARVCSGRNGQSVKNVKCRQIDPSPTSKNSEWQERVFWENKEEWSQS